MKVSVITTTYNHEKTIEKSILSVLSQSFKDYELIIIDDGSNDGTVNILKRYENYAIIKYNKHQGMMKSYLDAFDLCNGEYITFCDGDDYWVGKDRLSLYVDFMDKNKDYGICFSNVYTLCNNKITFKETLICNITFDNLLKGNANVYAQSFFIRKSVFDRYIKFEKFLKYYTWDYPILLELINKTKFNVLPYATAVFNKSNESVTQTRSRLKRLKIIFGNHKIKLYFILKYGCSLNTLLIITYKLLRNIYSLIFKTWT